MPVSKALGSLMNRKRKVIIISIVTSLIWAGLFSFRLLASNIDYNRVDKGLDPLFTYSEVMYRDGGTIRYFGFGYSVLKLNRLPDIERHPLGYEKGAILTYGLNWLFFEFNDKKNTYVSELKSQS